MNKELKFMYNGIKLEGKSYRAYYSIGQLTNRPENTITIYAMEYSHLPRIAELTVENNTDSMTDYFQKDRIRIEPTDKLYTEVYAAYIKQQAHRDKTMDKRMEKHQEKNVMVRRIDNLLICIKK